jgi:hypothetical protein
MIAQPGSGLATVHDRATLRRRERDVVKEQPFDAGQVGAGNNLFYASLELRHLCFADCLITARRRWPR